MFKDITETDIKAFERVRISNKTNMYDIEQVRALSGLNLSKIRFILSSNNYDRLIEKFKIIRP